jgi:hypothetical protein
MVLNKTSTPNISAVDSSYFEMDASVDPLVSGGGEEIKYNNGYIGSEATIKTTISNDKLECKIMMGNGKFSEE